MTKLTIITTTYNHEKFIEQALKGFVMQKTNFPFEAIISDDCSSDKTRQIITKYAKKYPNIIKPVFNKKNVGAMQNFIDTLSMAKSEYVALCDGDDYWTDENKLQKQVDFLDANPDFSICFHSTNIFFEDKSKPEEVYPKSFRKESTFDDLIKECFIPANTVVYRWRFKGKEKLIDVFPKNVVPGDYFIHLLHAQKGKIGYIDEVMSCYRRHEGGMWWLTSQPQEQDTFYMKYGISYIKFFKEVEKKFNLSSETYLSQKQYLAYNTMRCYIERKMFEQLLVFKNEHPELYNQYINEFQFASSVYGSLSTFKKALYLLVVDRSKFNSKIKEKLTVKSMLRVPMKLARRVKSLFHKLSGKKAKISK